ncbi:MAG: GNAT family N-acetyltransferase [Candidatus Woesearchaeota archaeon]|nr:GNAT family N-acetyltransferase [Candidatus Woesearchaeota archaeon]
MLPKKIIGKRIYLRQLKKSDAKQLVKICHDRSIHRSTRVPYPYRLKDALAFLKRTSARRKHRSEIVFGIISKETKELMGTVSFVRTNNRDNKTEIGYLIGKNYRNKGYVSEAVRLLLDFGFRKMKFHKIYINCAKENKASKRVIEKVGCKEEALLKEDIFVGGKYHDCYIHSILRKDWLKCH